MVFESGDPSLDSTRNCETTEVREPAAYDQVHVIQSTEDRFGFHRAIIELNHSRVSS